MLGDPFKSARLFEAGAASTTIDPADQCFPTAAGAERPVWTETGPPSNRAVLRGGRRPLSPAPGIKLCRAVTNDHDGASVGEKRRGAASVEHSAGPYTMPSSLVPPCTPLRAPISQRIDQARKVLVDHRAQRSCETRPGSAPCTRYARCGDPSACRMRRTHRGEIRRAALRSS